MSDAYKVACPTCGSGQGERCRTLKTNRTTESHEARWVQYNLYREDLYLCEDGEGNLSIWQARPDHPCGDEQIIRRYDIYHATCGGLMAVPRSDRERLTDLVWGLLTDGMERRDG